MKEHATKSFESENAVAEATAKTVGSEPKVVTEPVISVHKQKIQYLEKLKNEIFALKTQNNNLKKELSEVKKVNKTTSKFNSVSDYVCNNSENKLNQNNLSGKENGGVKTINKTSANSSTSTKSMLKKVMKS